MLKNYQQPELPMEFRAYLEEALASLKQNRGRGFVKDDGSDD